MSQPQDTNVLIIERETRRIRVLFEGHEIAESTDVVVLREPGRSPVRYFPRHDVEMTVLGQTRRQMVSATKGLATYFTINRDAHVVENAIWSFETPPPALAAIAGRLAFLRPHFEFQAKGDTPADWDSEPAGPD